MESLDHGTGATTEPQVDPMAYRQETPASLALSPEQQAEVSALIQTSGPDASEFVWAVQPNSYHLIGPLVSALVHTPTGYSFRFEFLESALGQNRVSVFTSKSRPTDEEPLPLGKIN